jgi:hypothetical protein
MALEPYLVICDQEAVAAREPQPKWLGAAAGSEVTSIHSARLVTVEAGSVAEAILGVRSLYGGWIKTTVLGVAKASVTEG